ncbi:bifunctional GNAT family N-acetyltransferase/carbon-nitrogen hydrolase family protein [Enhygromyxa salina]|uniref:bifunctional GNAT family N-acetyltransferase/carbon-nitrogen hydrolase family protein n=1 Tax=Enhygromyxa salina TaxID=215803 RepID=UPI001C63B515|nr:bifunctional GNAT family N-acetyltransferase/carbon-nitrogen hydrolase family protein [Enhygromyxa salina]
MTKPRPKSKSKPEPPSKATPAPKHEEVQVRVRRWRVEDVPAIVECQRKAYDDYTSSGMYDARNYEMQLHAFPEGQFLAEIGGKVVGYATSLIVQLEDLPGAYEYDELTGSGTFSTHTPGGDTLYGADIAVDPAFRGEGVAGKLYIHRHKLLKKYNLRRMVAYGRITGYPEHAGKMTAAEYVAAVERGELRDPALNAHLKAGYRVKRVSLEIMHDAPSLNWATFLELENLEFNPQRRRIAAPPLRRPVRKLRVCAAQYLMRRVDDWDAFAASIRFFAEVADEYNGHFLVLPELVIAVLLPLAPRGCDEIEAFRFVATFAERYLELVRGLAREFNFYIVAGSIPVVTDGEMRNVSYLVSPTGHAYAQEKLHVTPGERSAWGIRPGEGLRVFDTPLGRVAIQICYDIEFPELSRMLGLAGAEVIFVPFSTDERKAYQRVRYASAARAIENCVYVVLAGNAGNLPARNYLLNYARSAVLTSSDFGFPDDAVIAEADPNVETVVVADLDLHALSVLRQDGTVRPLQDRRSDLYEVRAKVPVEIISVE